MATFYDCPHARINIAMTKETEARKLISDQNEKGSDWIAKREAESNNGMEKTFTMINQGASMAETAFLLSGREEIYTYPTANKHSAKAASVVVTRGSFHIPVGS